jgi:hypothetical protein
VKVERDGYSSNRNDDILTTPEQLFINGGKKIMTTRILVFFILVFLVSVTLTTGCSAAKVRLVDNPEKKQVDVLIDGKLFTSYIYTDELEVLKKPVLYPLTSAHGTKITRYYPLESRAGERVDHPHHIGLWLNYGDVNGFDFWNNSDAIRGDRVTRMGTIYHKAIKNMQDGEQGVLEVTAEWMSGAGEKLLDEDTKFVFQGSENMRIIDRITTLTAVGQKVNFTDNKEGMLGLRVTRQLELPTDESLRLTDSEGKVTEVRVKDNTGVTGDYLTSEGIQGEAVWGTRAKWCVLNGTVDGEKLSVAIFDFPDNVGYPTYWHARPYGLFAANTLGQKPLSNGKDELNFALEAGGSVTFKYRTVIFSGETSKEQVEAEYNKFVQ